MNCIYSFGVEKNMWTVSSHIYRGFSFAVAFFAANLHPVCQPVRDAKIAAKTHHVVCAISLSLTAVVRWCIIGSAAAEPIFNTKLQSKKIFLFFSEYDINKIHWDTLDYAAVHQDISGNPGIYKDTLVHRDAMANVRVHWDILGCTGID